MARRPAQTDTVGGPIIFALNHVLWAAVIKAEDFIVDVENVTDECEALRHLVAALHVDLQVRVEVSVGEGSGDTSWCSRSCKAWALVLVAINVRVIVGDTQTEREGTQIVGRTDVPRVRNGTKQSRVIDSSGQTDGFRIRIA